MPSEEWIRTLEDGRRVKFIYQELPEDGAFLTAQLAGNEVVYSVVLTKARNPLNREDVETISRASFLRSSGTQFATLSAKQRFELDLLQSLKNFLTRITWLRYI